jgi:tRNA pseudouridine38-40 synthase
MITKLTLEYDGTDFAGWARQPGLRTVQEEVERVLAVFLKETVPVTVAGRTDRGVHARGDALGRTYCYRILHRRERSALERGRALWFGHRLDRGALDACAAALSGRQNFTAFTPNETDHAHFVREVRVAEWRHKGDLLEFWIEADAFMRHMNRVLVGTMLEVANGRRDLHDFVRLLEGRPRADAGATAAPHGLHLMSVRYRS